MRLFSLRYPDGVTVSHQLSWSHFVELLKIDDELAAKDEIMVEYATGGLSSKVFVSKYQTYLPDKDLLEEKVRDLMEEE